MLTVALPMYRSKHIGWLALESLARQENVNFEWELIVAEEREHAFRERRVRAYASALRRAGCTGIHYIGLEQWVPLSMKWRLIAQNAAPNSTVFVLQAADSYSPPRRLRETFDLMTDPETDWCHTIEGSLYHIGHRAALRFNAEMEGYSYPTGFYMAIRIALARALPPSDRERGIDRWMFEEATRIKSAPLNVAIGRHWWKGGVETKGLNVISSVDELFLRPSPPFYKDEEDLMRLLPADIRERLDALAFDDVPLDRERRDRLNNNLREYGWDQTKRVKSA